MEKAIEYSNLIFYVVFLLEFIVKLIGLGPASYFRDGQNMFDFFVMVMSTIDLGILVYVEALKKAGG